jgi:hypothetical protein
MTDSGFQTSERNAAGTVGRADVARLRREARYRLRYLVNAYPTLYMPLARRRHRTQPDWVVRPDTELVVEGFGRSGSTFAVMALNASQGRTVRTASHSHAAAQVLAAARMGIPTLVIVRRPVDVTVSHMARRGIGPRAPLIAWIRYHRRILPVRERLVAVSFDAMTHDMGAVIERVNERFGTCFTPFVHSPENVSAIFADIDAVNGGRFEGRAAERARALARPTAERELEKRRLQAAVEAPDLATLRRRADELYADITGG